METDRRAFLKASVATAAGIPVAASASEKGVAENTRRPVVDTNVDLFGWPHRPLKYGETKALVAKLRRHGVREAWAGSYDALFHKNVASVNRRLAKECAERGEGMLVPLGTVNPAWPDWEEDLRRCDEVHGMPGIKLYPSYQNYTLDHPHFEKLLEAATERGLFVELAVAMEDERVHHPSTLVPPVDVRPLARILQRVPDARVMLVHAFRHVRGNALQAMVDETNVLFEISNLDGVGGLERILRGDHWYLPVTMPADRLVFGSHAPLFPVENVCFKFVSSELTASQREAIWADNADRWMRGEP